MTCSIAQLLQHRVSHLLLHAQAIREASAKAAQNPLPGEAEVNAQEASGGPLGQEGQDTQKEFDDHLANWVSKYVEDSLARHFGSLVGARSCAMMREKMLSMQWPRAGLRWHCL